ncbi:MAG: tRNA epoxyqueuosine(34) reductase QueG [Proteobacteria bacterium]|nr:tRNA epoxyqueuosine(34) reductase QueG [Pseudomonadota bacterium]
MQAPDPKDAIRAHALGLGFDAVGFAPAAASDQAKAGLRAFLAAGMQGDMGWMAANADRRADPQALWPEARSVIVLALNYGPDHDPRADLARSNTGNLSVYARNRDYHDTIKKRLKALGRWMCDSFGGDCKVFVDTAPVMEKPLAQTAGLGWQGKHTNLVSRDFGSWLFLGAVFTTLDLAPDTASPDHCGECRACLDACPTAAFPGPYRLDARRCISYLTIEHKGHIPAEFRGPMGNRIYGCDDCLAACPWNKFAQAAREADFVPRADLTAPKLAELVRLDDAGFRARFAGSPVKRIGRDRFVRNVLVAVGNDGDPGLAGAVRALADDASPLVRAMAAWALKRLLPAAEFAALAQSRALCETDAAVAAEWSSV